MKAEQFVCWSGITDAEHNTTSGSNEALPVYMFGKKTKNAKAEHWQ